MTDTLPDVSDGGTNQITVEDRSTAPFIDWARPVYASQAVLEGIKQLALFCRRPDAIDLTRSIHCGDRARHAEYIILMIHGTGYTVLERDDYDDVVFWFGLVGPRAKQVVEGFERWLRTLDGAS